MISGFRLAVCFVALSVSGCATDGLKLPTTPVQAPACLPLVTYSPDQEKALGVALAALDPANPLVGAMADFGAMRAADRACLAHPPAPPG